MPNADSSSFLTDELWKRTSIFGLHLWVVLGFFVGAAIVVFLLLLSLYLTTKKRSSKTPFLTTPATKSSVIPTISREIQEIRVDPDKGPHPEPDPKEADIEIVKGNVINYPGLLSGSGQGSGEAAVVVAAPEVSHLGWGHWYTLRELEESTNGFSDENVVGEGGYGIVYHGVLKDDTKIAVKNLLNNRSDSYNNFHFNGNF